MLNGFLCCIIMGFLALFLYAVFYFVIGKWLNFFKKEYTALIIGKAKKETDTQLKDTIRNLKTGRENIIFDNVFVSNERLKSLFLQFEAVLIPYKNPKAY